MKHDRGDAERLDRADGERQDERAIGLADRDGQMFGMANDRECGAQYDGKQPDELDRHQPWRRRTAADRSSKEGKGEAGGDADAQEPFLAKDRSETPRTR